MKKGIILATAVMGLGIVAPMAQVVTPAPVSAKTSSRYSYVTTTGNTVSVTNVRKGSSITLFNNQNQKIKAVKANKAGTVTFKLNQAQVNQLTNTNVLAFKLSSGYKYNINFHFYGHSTVKIDTTGKTPVVTPTTPKSSATSTKHSYVTTTSNSVSVTNIRKGATVVLKNNLGQAIATKTASNAGTMIFNLSATQVRQLTRTDILAVQLSSGYQFEINFHFIGYQAPTSTTNNQTTTSSKTTNGFVNGVPAELQGNWQTKLGYFTGRWNLQGSNSKITVNDPEMLNNVQYKALGNHTYVLKGTENYYSNGNVMQYTVQKLSNGNLVLSTSNGTTQWHK